jgi:L-ascorbate metabolism protein UlaG (beta-lactamase superfamily)
MDRRRFLTTTAVGVGGASALAGLGGIAVGGIGVLPAPQTPTPHEWADNAITLAWLGHATVLINFYGVRVLTDPALFPRIGIGAWFTTVGLRRRTACALPPPQLPDIDLVLVSHAHFDHLDTRSLAAVRGRPAAVMAWNTADLLPRRRYSAVHELCWDQFVRINTPRGDIEIRAIEVKHWGARLGGDTHRGYTGYILRREGRALLFGGDTAHTPRFASHRRHGPFDAAIMPIGSYDPWIYNHCTPEQAVTMADAADARLFVPIHHKSFQLSHEPVDEPIERAQAALAKEAGRLLIRDVGDTARIA